MQFGWTVQIGFLISLSNIVMFETLHALIWYYFSSFVPNIELARVPQLVYTLSTVLSVYLQCTALQSHCRGKGLACASQWWASVSLLNLLSSTYSVDCTLLNRRDQTVTTLRMYRTQVCRFSTNAQTFKLFSVNLDFSLVREIIG